MEAVLTCISSCSSTQGILVESQLLKLSYIYIDMDAVAFICWRKHTSQSQVSLEIFRILQTSIKFYKHLKKQSSKHLENLKHPGFPAALARLEATPRVSTFQWDWQLWCQQAVLGRWTRRLAAIWEWSWSPWKKALNEFIISMKERIV
jgi:hypothetical protein